MSGRRVTFTAMDLPCAAEVERGYWRVTVGEITFSTSQDLAAAISEASGGIVDNDEAQRLADRIERELVARQRASSPVGDRGDVQAA